MSILVWKKFIADILIKELENKTLNNKWGTNKHSQNKINKFYFLILP